MDLDNLDDLLDKTLGPETKQKKGGVQQYIDADDLDDWGAPDSYAQKARPVQQIQIKKQTQQVDDWDCQIDSAWGNNHNNNNYQTNSKSNLQQPIPPQNIKKVDKASDEFEDLLGDANWDDEQMDVGNKQKWSYEVPQQKSQTHQQPVQQANQEQPGECYPLFIGGSAYMSGRTASSMKPFVCSKLRCTKCDKKVVRFEFDVKWKDSVDYIFVRNYNTQPDKLQTGVEAAPGYSAYACQCQWISANQLTKVETLTHLSWHCGGH